MNPKPIIGISMGDPAGIGPEIIAMALSRPQVHALCRPIVIGDADIIRKATSYARSSLMVRSVTAVSQAKFKPETIDVYQLKDINLTDMKLGTVSAAAGNAAFLAVKTMIELALAG